MPTVPKDDRVVPFRPQPSETDLMMALATMKDLGRIPKPDFATRAGFAGTPSENIEDRRGEEDPYARMLGGNKNYARALGLQGAYAPIPKGSKRPAGQLARDAGIYDIDRASLGVSGGSR